MPGVGTNHGTKRNGELTYRFPRETLSPETKPLWSRSCVEQEWSEKSSSNRGRVPESALSDAKLWKGAFRDDQKLSRIRRSKSDLNGEGSLENRHSPSDRRVRYPVNASRTDHRTRLGSFSGCPCSPSRSRRKYRKEPYSNWGRQAAISPAYDLEATSGAGPQGDRSGKGNGERGSRAIR